MSSQLDPEDLNEIIRTYQMYVQHIMMQFGGFTARYVGDGMLIHVGWPEAHEMDAEQAVRAALVVASSLMRISMKNYPLRVRIECRGALLIWMRSGIDFGLFSSDSL